MLAGFACRTGATESSGRNVHRYGVDVCAAGITDVVLLHLIGNVYQPPAEIVPASS